MEMIKLFISVCVPSVLTKELKEMIIQMFSRSSFIEGKLNETSIEILMEMIIRHGSHMKAECRQIINTLIKEVDNPKHTKIALQSLVQLTSNPQVIQSCYLLFDKGSLTTPILQSIIFVFLSSLSSTNYKKECAKGLMNCINSFIVEPPNEAYPSNTLMIKMQIEKSIDEMCPSHHPTVIANYLLKEKNLNKMKIGYYLIDNKQILREFLLLMNITKYTIYNALTVALHKFTLPNEIKSINQFVEIFSDIYSSSNSISQETARKL